MQATELELAKLRNRVDDLDKTLDETREERDRLRAEVERLKPKADETPPVQPEERVRCYLGRDGKLRCYKDRDECLFLDSQEDFDLAQPEQYTIDDGGKRIPLAEAIGIVRERPKQLAKLREMAGIPCKEMRV
jgi:hypothetical protein